jgi:hypothetical protein
MSVETLPTTENQTVGETPRSELLDELHRLFVYMDATPSPRDMRWNGRRDPDDYRQRFGSWNNALRAAGLPTL